MIWRSDVPLQRDPSARFLPLLVGFMVFLAALALGASLAMNRVVGEWETAFTGKLTVQLPPPEESGGDQKQRLDKVVALLEAVPEVTDLRVLPEAETRALVEPWLGAGANVEELPIPDLIAVSFDSGSSPDVTGLAIRIEEAVPGATLDNHQQWLSDVLESMRLLEIVALLVVIVVGIAAVLAVIFVTRTGLAIHRDVIQLLHLIGAKDSYVAQQFQRHALVLGLKGGIIGLLLALPAIFLIGKFLGSSQTAILPTVDFGWFEWTALVSLPFLAALIANLTARRTVMRTLSRLS
ncbi:cell division protein FtsX [Limibacillus halophilus]|uniref:Cell division transport system permease protein n=1 Tax=Limibacillus halophilus TaxID=1579333 RepID=A0A839SUS6_9PROT|nr:FtsX-like permease family protein [Limibacillus halophilus]MBB3066078.1 cell division transport system permease protein [Limibacillus halophilus]